jgi:hypothetical protein
MFDFRLGLQTAFTSLKLLKSFKIVAFCNEQSLLHALIPIQIKTKVGRSGVALILY